MNKAFRTNLWQEDVPDNERLVLVRERTGAVHVGWYDAPSKWWHVLSEESEDGYLFSQALTSRHLCSRYQIDPGPVNRRLFGGLSIAHVTGWKEIA